MRIGFFSFVLSFLFLGPLPIYASDCSQFDANGAHSPRFKAVGAGLVTDLVSGLTFKQCLEGQRYERSGCLDKARLFSWLDADAHAKTTKFAGFDDWRLPKIEELLILLEGRCQSPLIISNTFPSLFAQQLWSASPGAPVNDHSVVLDVGTGQIFGVGRGVERQLLLVRGTPHLRWLEREPPSDWVTR